MNAIRNLIQEARANETAAPEIPWSHIDAAASELGALEAESREARELLETVGNAVNKALDHAMMTTAYLILNNELFRIGKFLAEHPKRAVKP